MLFSTSTIAAVALAFASTVSAHATMFGVSVNGQDQGDGRDKYIRTPASNDPVRDLKSPNLVCNTNGGKPAPSFVKAPAGASLTSRWFHFNPNDPNDIIDPSHKGPIITYIAPFTEGNGAGPMWSKIDEQGFENGEWAIIKMRNNGGKVNFKLPSTLAPGQYLIRQELLALHMADFRGDQVEGRGAESYPSCFQVEVTGNGEAIPDQDFDFNRGYTYDNPGLFFNIHIPFDKYTPPGPPVWKSRRMRKMKRPKRPHFINTVVPEARI
ncbi:glycosyl hydrolase family 61-domain-containing protein [Podospora australis]|uniref:lytic cellulose monooxygenase (C4-dehydrogenating) n=1 Tax=Podospora australis TaxID=1536484 RepID=A0AAN7AEJ4_9PEZI|nr:glycosyl hydrolase family 61-domain-containing protein [Podospora australis]